MFKKILFFSAYLFASVCLFCLNIFKRTKVTCLISSRIGHLVLNTEAFFRTADNSVKYIVLSFPPVANNFLLNKWQVCLDNITIIDARQHPLLARILHSLSKFNSRYWIDLPFYSENNSSFWKSTSPVFFLDDKDKRMGEKILVENGISLGDWFVCIFARDGAYLDQERAHYGKEKMDWRYHDYRDSDINTLNLAIQEILDRGGWVIRLGKIVAREMSFKHPKVIDYPFTEWRSDFMDIYLQYRAKFVLSSSSSGATDVVALFNTPYCGVNMPFNWRGGYKDMIQIPKKYKRNGKYLTFNEWVEIAKKDNTYYRSEFYIRHGLEIIDNSPEEILQITKEMFDRLDGNFKETLEDRNMQDRYDCLSQNYIPFEKSKSPIGRDFLRNNPWYLE